MPKLTSAQMRWECKGESDPTLMMIICRLLLFIHMKLMANANGSERVSVFKPLSPARKRSRTTHAHTIKEIETSKVIDSIEIVIIHFFSFHFSHFILILCLPACTTFPFRYSLCECGRQKSTETNYTRGGRNVCCCCSMFRIQHVNHVMVFVRALRIRHRICGDGKWHSQFTHWASQCCVCVYL